MKRLYGWIFAVFTAMLMAGTANAQCWSCGGGGTGGVTETSSAYGNEFGVNVNMWGTAYAEGGKTVAGSFGSFNWSAAPVMVDGEEVVPISLSARFQGYSEGTEYVEAGGALSAHGAMSQSVWDWSRVDEGAGTSAYSAGGDYYADVGAEGYVYGNESAIGAVGQYNYAVDLGNDVEAAFGGIFGFSQEGEGYLDGYGRANGGFGFQVDYSDWGWTSGH